MKGIYFFIFIFLFKPCSADYWTQKADLPAQGRDAAIAFVIGNYGFAGTGYGTFDDLWQYDPLLNNWAAKAVVPNQPRYGAVGAACLGMGYVGLGGFLGFKNDWWEYDPISNAWTQKNNFPGSPREYASSFCIDSIVYVGCGLDSIGPQRDWWKYDIGSNSWGAIDSIPGFSQSGAFACVSFSILGKGYVISGYFNGNKVFEYDPISHVWNSKNLFPGIGRYAATGFSIGNYGYIGTGDTGYQTPFVKDFWQYDPSTDLWYQKNDFSGLARASAIGFTIGTNGYLGFGVAGTLRLNDFWEYIPDSITSTSEISYQQSEIILFPNPTKGKLSFLLPFGGNMHLAVNQIEIYNLFGKQVLTVTGWGLTTVDCGLLPPGIYLLQATSGEKIWRTKVVKE